MKNFDETEFRVWDIKFNPDMQVKFALDDIEFALEAKLNEILEYFGCEYPWTSGCAHVSRIAERLFEEIFEVEVCSWNENHYMKTLRDFVGETRLKNIVETNPKIMHGFDPIDVLRHIAKQKEKQNDE